MEFGQIVKVGNAPAVYLYKGDGLSVVTFDIAAFAAGRRDFITYEFKEVTPLKLDTFERGQLVYASVEGKLMLVQYVAMRGTHNHIVRISPGQNVRVTNVRLPTAAEVDILFPQYRFKEAL